MSSSSSSWHFVHSGTYGAMPTLTEGSCRYSRVRVKFLVSSLPSVSTTLTPNWYSPVSESTGSLHLGRCVCRLIEEPCDAACNISYNRCGVCGTIINSSSSKKKGRVNCNNKILPT